MRRVEIGAVILGGFWPYNNGDLDSILGSVAPDYVSNAEPAAYGFLLLGKGGVIAHSEDVGLNFPPISGSNAQPEH